MAKANQKTQDQPDNNIVILKGIAMYPKVFNPDAGYQGKNPKWVVDILLDADELAKAKALDIRVKTKYQKGAKKGEMIYDPSDLPKGYDGSFVRFERPTHNRDGDPYDPPKVVDAKRNPVSAKTNIGNGTVMKARAFIKNQNPNAVEEYGGYGVFLLGVQIIELVTFEREDGEFDDFDEEDGFVAPNASGFDFEKGDPLPDFDDEGTILDAG